MKLYPDMCCVIDFQTPLPKRRRKPSLLTPKVRVTVSLMEKGSLSWVPPDYKKRPQKMTTKNDHKNDYKSGLETSDKILKSYPNMPTYSYCCSMIINTSSSSS